MTNVVKFDPQEIEHTAHAISALTHAVPGVYQAIYETIGLFWTDPIKRRRREKNLKAEFDMAEKMIKGQKRLDDISATLAKEVLEPAMEEDREELQKIWAALLARLMTAELSTIRAEWIEIIKKLQPIDAGVLFLIKEESKNSYIEFSAAKVFVNVRQLYNNINFDNLDITLSLDSLSRYGILIYSSNYDVNSPNPTYCITKIGQKIMEIISPPESK